MEGRIKISGKVVEVGQVGIKSSEYLSTLFSCIGVYFSREINKHYSTTPEFRFISNTVEEAVHYSKNYL